MLQVAQAPAPPVPYWLDGWVTATNLPTYLTGILAAVGLIFAIRASNASRRSADASRKQVDRLRGLDEQEQASELGIWVKFGSTKIERFHLDDPRLKGIAVVDLTI